MSIGQAFVFVFPFGILRTKDEIEPQVFACDGLTIRLYAPHVNGDELTTGRPLDYESIPSRPGAGIPTNALMQLALKRRLPEGANRVVVSQIAARRALTNQPLASIRSATRIAFGTSFPKDSPSVAGLNRLQTVRNCLAHGDARELEQASEIRDHAACWVVQHAAFDLFNWAAVVRPRTMPDPVLAFERPMVPLETGGANNV